MEIQSDELKTHYCKICQNKYTDYRDPFKIIIDTNTFTDITNEFCLTCVYSLKNCLECNREFNEPWDSIVFDIENKTYYCVCCYEDERNKCYKKCLISYCINCSEKYEEIEQLNKTKIWLPFKAKGKMPDTL